MTDELFFLTSDQAARFNSPRFREKHLNSGLPGSLQLKQVEPIHSPSFAIVLQSLRLFRSQGDEALNPRPLLRPWFGRRLRRLSAAGK